MLVYFKQIFFEKHEIPLCRTHKNMKKTRKKQKTYFFWKNSKIVLGANFGPIRLLMVLKQVNFKNMKMRFTKERCIQNMFFYLFWKTGKGGMDRKNFWGGRFFFPNANFGFTFYRLLHLNLVKSFTEDIIKYCYQ